MADKCRQSHAIQHERVRWDGGWRRAIIRIGDHRGVRVRRLAGHGMWVVAF